MGWRWAIGAAVLPWVLGTVGRLILEPTPWPAWVCECVLPARAVFVFTRIHTVSTRMGSYIDTWNPGCQDPLGLSTQYAVGGACQGKEKNLANLNQNEHNERWKEGARKYSAALLK